jgi:hypothetical protein
VLLLLPVGELLVIKVAITEIPNKLTNADLDKFVLSVPLDLVIDVLLRHFPIAVHVKLVLLN